MKSSGKVTVKDIAQKMNVSLSTVNKALTGKSGISEKRRAQIISVARELGYEVNLVAQSLSRKPIKIGIIVPSDWKHYFAPIEAGMESGLQSLSHSNVTGQFIHISQESEILSALTYFCAEGFDAIIYCPSNLRLAEETRKFMEECRVPIMLSGADCADVNSVCTVSIDSELSGRLAADFLSLLLRQNKKVAVFIGSRQIDTHIRKAISFVERAEELGLETVDVHETGDDSEKTTACVKATLEKHPELGGIYVATGSVTPVVECFSDNCPYIVATDIYDAVKGYMQKGYVSATVFQNQVLMGRLSIEYAYKYLVQKSSYSISPTPLPSRIFVSPRLMLMSNLDCFGVDDGNDYRVEY